ncbi:unnamed protein product [Spirodela intermedia]|uniref:Uncharacterized protein n=1 Tax=Spirodela intermedia TaxID=51605 RepID=A0A7I8LFT0_SPIIN|nr:unnamed protein product [Spirodela intermedia]
MGSDSGAVGGGITEALLPGHKEQRQGVAEAGAGALGLRPWYEYPSTASRICRVSRASGGKDRHSKVFTAKGLRDRRVRLSVSTAIQFYDLQDRLGYDQPSKAVEWLIKAAAVAIADLPSLDGTFPDQPLLEGQPGNEGKPTRMADDDEGVEVAQFEYANHHQGQEQHRQQPEHLSLTKSACSSTSETSRGSVLSLSRSEIRIKARERARERAATAKKEKDKDGDDGDTQIAAVARHHSLNLNPTTHSSFIELLTGGGSGHQHQNHNHGPVTVAQANPAHDFNLKQLRQMPTSSSVVTADYFSQVGLLGGGEKSHQSHGFPAQGNFNLAAVAASTTGDHPEMLQHQQQQQFSFLPDHLIPLAVTASGGDCINFSISSGVTGFNRGTLQSNFPPPQPLQHLQRLSSPIGGSNLPFFLGATVQPTSAAWEAQLPNGFDSRLQLYYDGYPHLDLKGKEKS